MSWYEATRILSGHRETQTPIEQVTPVAYFENLFPEFAGAFGLGATATQEVYGLMSDDGFGLANDWTFAQLLIDDDGIFPNMFFHPQWAALSAFSTLASSDYHAMTFSVRERLRDSLSFDFNYTWSKSMDNASGLQASSQYDSAFILNPLDLDISRSISDFDTQHIINSNWLWSLPVGRGRSYLSDMPAAADAVLGGWSLNGVFRWNSGLPQETPFEASRWATNWNVSNWGARIRDPGSNPSRGGDHPNAFADPEFAYQSFRETYAGEVGDRNVFRRQGFFTLDFGLHKAFGMPYNEDHTLVFRWEVFNATNTQTLFRARNSRDAWGLGAAPSRGDPAPSFGNIVQIQGSPRVMQFGLRYDF